MMMPTRQFGTARKKQAFTFVELLVVLLILSVLISLVVGLSNYIAGLTAKQRTQATEMVLMDAIKYDEAGGNGGSEYDL